MLFDLRAAFALYLVVVQEFTLVIDRRVFRCEGDVGSLLVTEVRSVSERFVGTEGVDRRVGGVDRILDFSARFAKPVVVPEGDEGTTVTVSASIRKTNDDGTTELAVTVTCDGVKVLSPCRATLLAKAS